MTLKEAIETLNAARGATEAEQVFLACGITPLHLQTFLAAHTQRRIGSGRKVEILTGLYGDCPGNAERAARQGAPTVLLIEWQDLDPRLSIRGTGGFLPSREADILGEVEAKLGRFQSAVADIASKAPVVVCGPTLPFPPIAYTPPGQASTGWLRMQHLINGFLCRCGELPGVRVVNPQLLAELSPAAERMDPKAELLTGFPYRMRHAEVLAGMMASVLYPPPAKKGLVVDLDNTFWSGIVGEIGVENVCWDLGNKAQVHGLLQQMIAALAESGVLVAVASKNDPSIVAEAFRRTDLLVRAESLFPLEVSWGPKSAAIDRILQAWNIGPDAVVFIDDSALELAEVNAAHPNVECLQFNRDDPQAVWNLLWKLRELFGKPALQAEDRLRSASLKAAAEMRKQAQDAGGEASPDFLRGVEGRVTLEFRTNGAQDSRAFELVNKTNQFNLNGRRYTEAQWQGMLTQPGAFLVTVSYEDKFGPLGKIAAIAGRQQDDHLQVHAWVMSCRAFSRRIEQHTLERLFTHFKASAVVLDYEKTDRNMPLQEYLSSIKDPLVPGQVTVGADEFQRSCGPIPHSVVELHA